MAAMNCQSAPLDVQMIGRECSMGFSRSPPVRQQARCDAVAWLRVWMMISASEELVDRLEFRLFRNRPAFATA